MTRRISLLWVALLACVTSSVAFAETAVFRAGVSDATGANAAYDSELTSLNEGFNAGTPGAVAEQNLGNSAGSRQRMLVRFNVSSLNGLASKITGARLKLVGKTVVYSADNSVVLPSVYHVNLHRILPTNKSWVEGTGTAADSIVVGAASWAWRQVGDATGSTGVGWDGGDWYRPNDAETNDIRGLTNPGIDYDPVPVASFAATTAYADDTALTLEFTDARFLSAWITSPADNAGFVLIIPEFEAATVASGQYLVLQCRTDDAPVALADLRPTLEVDYEPGSDPLPAFSTLVFQNGVSDASGANTAYGEGVNSSQVSISMIDSSTTASQFGTYRADLGHKAWGASDDSARALYRFDLTSIADELGTVTVVGARLVISAVGTVTEGATLASKSYELPIWGVTAANADWVEGSGDPGTVQAGSACWGQKQNGVANWAGSGGLSTEGVDYLATQAGGSWRNLSTLPMFDGWQLGFAFTDVALVQNWVAHPEQNGGVMFWSPDLEAEARRLDTNVMLTTYTDDFNRGIARLKPRLEVDVLNVAPPTVTSARMWTAFE